MSSWKKVKEDVLVKCKRYCCKCRVYQGVNIEVHHIIPRAKGGDDSFDNVIPLCLICHSEVGSYNPQHPKGNKYSEGELKRIRDAFYEIVDSLPFCKELSEHDRNLLEMFKDDITEVVEYCIEKDFSAEPIRLTLADELESIIDYWQKKKNTFETIEVEEVKIAILQCLADLIGYLTPNYFHAIDGMRIVFNSSSLDDGGRICELREASIKYRSKLKSLLDILYTY